METSIRNIFELQGEIGRLKNLEARQAVALKTRFSGPSAIFSTVLSLFPKSPMVDGMKDSGFFQQDFLGLISRFVLPLALNKTLFKHSNFIVKTLVGILSQKASHYISEENVTGVWGKAKGLFENLFKKKEKETEIALDKDEVPAYQAY
ncbi:MULTISPECIES: hypothetical protein [unclassified Mucilaginibacter]|uniref:hypothetical protein n=1 Tax=unclassified Mucilaginibacter TaxID=2617802 RepID=UPI002AC9D68D|nr:MULTISPECIES: hypothetical protein [unclassified Mucilaginibacter]MEB0263683.1 hypothetical protein [Mucilaginibacter sp. 10I4]MEB0280786.1 hypothetical protein [Mucilaginibacter sp. 10B2]MEB0302111.1 hypothetical protein [Mucilaginibacter sp. 5C4]WPX24328.1 hypothetical protein RHM67_03460 [Mucilaginibacter sp. 5C4]